MVTWRDDSKRHLKRILKKTTKLPTGCWEWQGLRFSEGYGRTKLLGSKETLTHRISWLLHGNEIPSGLCVLHRCDNPPCLNPEHLFLGTRGDNNRDREAKGRGGQPRGSANGQSKLNAAMVREIRQRSDEEGGRSLAQEYGVSPTSIRNILDGVTWSWVI